MELTKDYYITTAKDGELDDITTADIDRMFVALETKKKVVLHFHGGLVSKSAGMGIAARRLNTYLDAGAHPVFFVYESQVWEVIPRNLGEIAGEQAFRSLLEWLLKHVVGKFRAADGTKAVGAAKPSDLDLQRELAKRKQDQEPYKGEAVPASVQPVTPQQEAELEQDLTDDENFQRTLQAIANEATPEPETSTGTRGLVLQVKKSGKTLMSPEIVEELQRDVGTANARGSRGVLGTAVLVVRAGKVLIRIIDRFRQKRDHGIYCTVVEEILREFYIANIGAIVWKAIKQETWDTFQMGAKARGGSYFLQKFGKLLSSKNPSGWPQVTVVGHSTGAVFINNLLEAVQAAQDAGSFPQAFKYCNVIFLAPACTMWAFNKTITKYRGLYQHFRVFGMSDAVESEDRMLLPIYTRSLLYFVSGLLECDATQKVYADVPLVGMERYFTSPDVYALPEEKAVRDYVLGQQGQTVWSISNGAIGFRSTARHHGDFDDDTPTLESVQEMIKGNCNS